MAKKNPGYKMAMGSKIGQNPLKPVPMPKRDQARVRSNLRNGLGVSSRRDQDARNIRASDLKFARKATKLGLLKASQAPKMYGKGKAGQIKARANGAYAGTNKAAFAKNRSSARHGLTDMNQGVGAHAKARAAKAAELKGARARGFGYKSGASTRTAAQKAASIANLKKGRSSIRRKR